MATVTTVALIARKQGMSRELFSRYWRDVHGTLAARIPGFETYIQYHLGDPVEGLHFPNSNCEAGTGDRFDGFAEVTYANETDRDGLASSDVAAMIHEDEQNAFRTTLLYNLASNASRTLFIRPEAETTSTTGALLLLSTCNHADALDDAWIDRIAVALAHHPGIVSIRCHALATGNPRDWATPNVAHGGDTPAYDAIVQVTASSLTALVAALYLALAQDASSFAPIGSLQVYPVTARYVMVDGSRPTLLGLRGKDVQDTIDAAGARNQCTPTLLQRLYGTAPVHS